MKNTVNSPTIVIGTIKAKTDTTNGATIGVDVEGTGVVPYSVSASVHWFRSKTKANISVKENSCMAYVPPGATYEIVGQKDNDKFEVKWVAIPLP